MKPNVLKWISMGLSAVTAVAGLAIDYFNDKKLDAKVAAEVAKQLNNK